MSFCRICRTEQQQNLKYGPEQLIKIRENNYSRAQNEIMDENACTLGNICYDCEERLLSFSKLGDALDLDADSGRGETPVIVDDDDELLYNFFFEKMKLHQKMQHQEQEQQRPQQHLNTNCSSSESDVEIIELLPSRDNSPHNKKKIVKINQQQHKNEDFIDLAEEASCSGVSQVSKKPCKVESGFMHNNKKRKRQKYYDESKINLLAKLNLVSSDSEADEAYTPRNWITMDKARNDKHATKVKKSAEYPMAMERRQIKIKKDIDKSYEINKCPVCNLTHNCNQSLIQHIRNRHRDNEQETELRECERLEQDSALTIRLCYQSKINYYECQLCGCIDLKFDAHQQHVIDKHSAELRSLKDPLLQKLQCPICNIECNGKYIDLCRHMLAQHRKPQYKKYLTEVSRHAKVPGVLKNQQCELEKNARVFQFINGHNWYFQCRKCNKLSSNYKTHQKHITEAHAVKFKININNKNINNKKMEIDQRSTRQQGSMGETSKSKNSKPIAKTMKTRETTKRIKAILAKPAKEIPLKVKTKTTTKAVFQVKASKVIYVKPLKTSLDKPKKRGRKSLDNKIKVNKLPDLLQVPTQFYACEYCCFSFKGYTKLNLHIMKKHAEKEFYSCHKCVKNFPNKVSFNAHEKYHEFLELNGQSQRQRKRIRGACLNLDENSNTAKADCCKLLSNNNLELEKKTNPLKP